MKWLPGEDIQRRISVTYQGRSESGPFQIADQETRNQRIVFSNEHLLDIRDCGSRTLPGAGQRRGYVEQRSKLQVGRLTRLQREVCAETVDAIEQGPVWILRQNNYRQAQAFIL